MKPVHAQVPVFLNFHVFVKIFPAGTLELSGMVTSSSNTALSLHFTDFVRKAVPVAGAGNGVRVGRGVASFVGGRVEVTKRGADCGVAVCTETVMQDVKSIERRKVKNIFLVMGLSEHHHLTFGLFNRVACDLLFESFTRQYRELGQGAQ